MSTGEHRQHPRFRVALRAHLALPGGVVVATTQGVSRGGVSVRLSPPLPAIGAELPITLELPSGTSIDAVATCRNHLLGGLCGMRLALKGDAAAQWDSFVDEEERTGSLWRMIGRMARAPDDALAPRGMHARVAHDELRFHTVGENGEAYRVAFERHAADGPEASDLAISLPGFLDVARQQVTRVLREPVQLSFDDGQSVARARVVELARGGYASVAEGAEPGLVSLCVGELMLVTKNGQTVFPHFSVDDLERVACDTFRRDLQRKVFDRPRGLRPAPVTLPPLPRPTPPPAKFREGLGAVRFAQAAAEDVQTRVYGERQIWFHPSVWVRVQDAASELMGPTLQDGDRVCVLALVGPGAPRVVRLDEESKVKLLKPPTRSGG
ncbi:MAG: PilZ domain-containing protein [Deltaproteobacteria bacterium]|nr:PilZ domain-containing protein [Deltaproteobacteria bacterium]